MMEVAKDEISKSLYLAKYCMSCIGLSLEDPKDIISKSYQILMFLLTVCSIFYHIFADFVLILTLLSNSPKVEDVAPSLHLSGYAILSAAKIFVLWYKKDIFHQLIEDLTDIWPVTSLDAEERLMKQKSLAKLHRFHKWYFVLHFVGLWLYNLTPIFVYLYKVFHNKEASLGFIWVSWYPFDTSRILAHAAVYIFEMFIGQVCVWTTLGTDYLFTGLASHISFMLRLLKRRLEALALTKRTNEEYYQEIVANIKMHQRLVRYCSDIEEAFSFSNLINTLISCINISCVVFVIVVIEPVFAMHSKAFLMSALLQIGAICWYGDNILHANADIATAAYNNRWYVTSPKCKRTLLFFIIRAQKPIAFTAWKITNMSLVTYAKILSKSYSYFALLYTLYAKK